MRCYKMLSVVITNSKIWTFCNATHVAVIDEVSVLITSTVWYSFGKHSRQEKEATFSRTERRRRRRKKIWKKINVCDKWSIRLWLVNGFAKILRMHLVGLLEWFCANMKWMTKYLLWVSATQSSVNCMSAKENLLKFLMSNFVYLLCFSNKTTAYEYRRAVRVF